MLPEPTMAAILDELRQIKLLLGAVAARQAAGPSAGQLAELLGGRTLLIPRENCSESAKAYAEQLAQHLAGRHSE